MADIKNLSSNLKNIVAEYHPDIFISAIATHIKSIIFPPFRQEIEGLVSPLKQLLYLANLNITSDIRLIEKHSLGESDWRHIKQVLAEIDYFYQDSILSDISSSSEEDRIRTISLSTYNAFFHQGPLKFEEQIIEKIQQIFSPFSSKLKSEFGLDHNDLVAIYDILDELNDTKLNSPFKKKEEDRKLLESVKKGILNGKHSFLEGMAKIGEENEALFNPISTHIFVKEEIRHLYDEAKIDLFLSIFCTSRDQNDNFLYFSNQNQLFYKPIYKLQTGKYLVIEYKTLLDAIYLFLSKKVLSGNSKALKNRDKFLEKKSHQVFNKFFSKDKGVKHYENYYVDGSEHDLLILTGKTALIIEAKAGNIREPSFDPLRAYDKIKKDFDKTIGYAYEQTFKVKEYFIDSVEFDIYDKKGRHLDKINPKFFRQVFSIIVTLEKFGQIQSDLSAMLELYEDDVYPWAVCIDDVEVFLLSMIKKRFSLSDLTLFWNLRSKLHGKLITNDEGQVTGHFLRNKNFIKMKSPLGLYQPSILDAEIYDKLYASGLGFDNERGIDRKTDSRYLKFF